MKRFMAFVIAVFVIGFPVSVARRSSSCTVTPDPVSFGQDFVVEAALDPLRAYDIRIDQSDHFGHHDDASGIYSDAAGHWTWAYHLWNDPRDGLVVGTANIHVKPSSVVARADKGSGGAACDVTVIP